MPIRWPWIVALLWTVSACIAQTPSTQKTIFDFDGTPRTPAKEPAKGESNPALPPKPQEAHTGNVRKITYIVQRSDDAETLKGIKAELIKSIGYIKPETMAYNVLLVHQGRTAQLYEKLTVKTAEPFEDQVNRLFETPATKDGGLAEAVRSASGDGTALLYILTDDRSLDANAVPAVAAANPAARMKINVILYATQGKPDPGAMKHATDISKAGGGIIVARSFLQW